MGTKGNATREKIITTSLQLFSVKGFYNTSVADILAATGLTKGGLYGHYKSKEEIWFAAYDRAVAVWKEIVFKGVRTVEDPLERLEKALDNDLTRYLGGDVFQGGCFFLNTLVEVAGQSGVMQDHLFKGIMGFSTVIRTWLEEARDKEMLRPGLDLEAAAKFVVVALNGCAALYAAGRDPAIWQITLDQLKCFINGLKK